MMRIAKFKCPRAERSLRFEQLGLSLREAAITVILSIFSLARDA